MEVVSQNGNFYCNVLNGFAGRESGFVETRKRKLQLWICENENLNQSFTKEKGAEFLRRYAGRMNMIYVKQVASCKLCTLKRTLLPFTG